MSDKNETEDDQCNEDKEWSVFSSEQFCNVTSKVVVCETNKATSLLEWIRGQSDFNIYINDMWIDDGRVLRFKAETAIATHVRAWMNQLVTMQECC